MQRKNVPFAQNIMKVIYKKIFYVKNASRKIKKRKKIVRENQYLLFNKKNRKNVLIVIILSTAHQMMLNCPNYFVKIV